MAMPPLEQINQLHVRQSKTDGKPVILSHTKGISDPYAPVNKLMEFPEPLTDSLDSNAMKTLFPDLVEKSSSLY